MKTLKTILLLSVFISLLIHFINYAALGFNQDFLWNWKKPMINFVYAACIGLTNILFFSYLNRLFSWEKSPKKMLLIGVFGSVFLSTLAFFVARVTHFVALESYTFSQFLEIEFFGNYLFAMLIAFVVTLCFHLFYFGKALQEAKLKNQQIIAEQNTAKFEALKSQLDPHFLFNSLNVLTSLIEEDQEKATQFTTSLSHVYRYVLEQRNKDLVKVKEEIDFIKIYAKLISMRFEDAFELQLSDSINQELLMPPLALQLLVENAIKHNKISVKQPLKVSIEQESDYLIIKNTLQFKSHFSSENTGIGLANIKSRYANFTTSAIQIFNDNNYFQVSLPLIPTTNE